MDTEILEFIRPDGEKHSLYITGVPQSVTAEQLYDFLEAKFGQFGLIYEVQIIDTNPGIKETDQPKQPAETHPFPDVHNNFGSLYAFVKFYSPYAAVQARTLLTGRLILSGQQLRIRPSTRKAPPEQKSLYVTKCYELANHHLGFNGWSVDILMIRQNEDHTKIEPSEVQFICGVKLLVKQHGLTCEGYGVATMAYDLNEPTTKSVAYCRAKKQAYSEAVQYAFRKILLVVLDNGKVYAEADCTAEERVYCDEQLNMDSVIKVNDLDLNPLEESDSDEFDESLDMDLLNQQLLEQMENENC